MKSPKSETHGLRNLRKPRPLREPTLSKSGGMCRATPFRGGVGGEHQARRGALPAWRRTWRLAPVVFGLVLLALGLPARAQYALNWFTVDGGGGASAGGPYAISGTIAQPDTGLMHGGTFTLEGGFWPVLVASVVGDPTLFIQLAGNLVTISWSSPTTGYALEMTEDLAMPAWTPVAGGSSSPTTLVIGAKTSFFRLVKP